VNLLSSKSGITKKWVAALLAIIVLGSVIGAYELSKLSSPSPGSTPSPAIPATPTNIPNFTPSQAPKTSIHTPTPTATSLTPTPKQTPNPASASPTPVGPQFVNVTGYAQYELSQTEFVFNTGTATYNVTMDLTTQAINLNGKLLGGYQIVSQIIPVTSLQLTVTGTLSGSTIMAQTVLIPTTKDKIT